MSNASLTINQNSDGDAAVLDLSANPIQVPGTTLTLDMSEELVEAQADLTLEAFGLVDLTGTFTFSKRALGFDVAGGPAGTPDFSREALLLGATIASADVGVDGLGLTLTTVEVGALLVSDGSGTSYSAIKASAVSATFTGFGGLDVYRLTKFRRSNQDTCINQRPLVYPGDRVKPAAFRIRS